MDQSDQSDMKYYLIILILTRELTWCRYIPTKRTGSSPTQSVRGTRGFGPEDRGSHTDLISGSGLMEPASITPNSVPGDRTTDGAIKTVWTLAGVPLTEKPGTINPVIIGYLSFARN